MGKKRQPIYKLVAADVRSPRDGRFIEAIGIYNPKSNPAMIDIKEDRALYWLGVGAQPTDTVRNLFSKKGIMLKNDLSKRGVDEAQVEAKVEEFKKAGEAKDAAAGKKAEEKAKKAEQEAKAVKDAEVKAAKEAEKAAKEAEALAAKEAAAKAAAEEAVVEEVVEDAAEVKDAASEETKPEEKAE